ncbi:uncharacterized protein LOC127798317 [Diospyros lotus]|uniref:uncharacterized protein LOC127798317 n=1 Tax=Diospyros lotus TaxID=55363 RepID=UPI00225B86DD|nr:uncharacterized protein LOC127798317 [Diospyros lotus]
MELVVITTLCLCLSALLPLCSSQQFEVPEAQALPKRLRLTEELATAKMNGDEELMPYNHQKADLSRKHNEEESRVQARVGTWREWSEMGAGSSEFFTMDYSHVRRRRPIHNKNKRLRAGP